MAAAEHLPATPARDAIRPKFRQPVPLEGDDGLYSQTWWPVCVSAELGKGQIKGVDFLDGKVVAWRDDGGVAHVHSAWCPHMGTDLSVGKVVGDRIQCAFHNWQFGPTGQCVGALWAKKVPERARLFAFPTVEKWGLVWAFNGEEPLWDMPTLDVPDDHLLVKHQRVPINECDPFMFTANAFDFQHFGALHDFWPGDEVSDADVGIRWGKYDVEYSYGGKHWLGEDIFYRIRIYGTNIYLQDGTYQGQYYANLICAGLPRKRYSDTHLVILMPRGDGTPAGLTRAQHLADNLAFTEMKFIMQDAAVLNGIKFGPGYLLPEDKYFVQFVNWVRKYPKANPALHYIT
jgi:phenylpropionate dioxygenase-like ring-hydroxylating dioxygenase large terminal subunit